MQKVEKGVIKITKLMKMAMLPVKKDMKNDTKRI